MTTNEAESNSLQDAVEYTYNIYIETLSDYIKEQLKHSTGTLVTDGVVHRLHKRLESMKEELEGLREENDKHKITIKEQQAEIKELKERLAKVTPAYEAIVTTFPMPVGVKIPSQETLKLREENKSLQHTVEKHEEHIQILKNHICSSEKAYARLKSAIDMPEEGVIKELEKSHEEVFALHKILAERDLQLDACGMINKELHKANEQLRKDVVSYETQKQEMCKIIENKEKAIENAQAQSGSVKVALRKALDNLAALNECLSYNEK